ncbi:DUF6491 family protein [Caulobacter sp. S45]|jgi:hypothetical protein|uniref:DUF6491 family protein n=1 Tax=Caulobacter sp. S45 TaxID=1641861 RepID=UPI00131E27AE|nr:DUF6491 family protein [Caulobacter sp. S45]
MLRPLRGLLIGAACLAAGSASAKDQPDRKPSQCFRSRDYQGFRPIDAHAMYIRVNVRDIYRIEFQDECREITYPDARLITVIRGSDQICGPLDWDLKVGQSPPDIPVPCIVKSQTPLTAAEAAAIPAKQRP